MLVERMERYGAQAWLVNTGWTGGPYGTGERMNINHTRSMVRAALEGRLDDVPTVTDPIFGVEVPTSCPDVPSEVLQPRATWPDPEAYDRRRSDSPRCSPRTSSATPRASGTTCGPPAPASTTERAGSALGAGAASREPGS